MRYYTHIAVTFTAVHLAGSSLSVPVSAADAAAASGLLLGSVLPDIDETRSWLGRRIPVLSTVIKMLFGHRGITHSGLVLAGMAAGLSFFEGSFIQGLMTGVIIHILADFFSVGGIPLLYPFSRKRSQIALYRTGKWSEAVIFGACAGYWIITFF